MSWNFDVTQAPREGKVILATKCNKVIVTHYVAKEQRWNFLAAGEQPVAWQHYPTHPGVKPAFEGIFE